jgi:hypothetical protein
VRFHGKPKIYCLCPEGFSHSPYLCCHPSLVLNREEMFDYGVAEDYIQTSVANWLRLVVSPTTDSMLEKSFGSARRLRVTI